MKRILIALVLCLLLIPSAASAEGVDVVGETGDGVWVGDSWKVELYPGESGNTIIALRNSSGSSLETWVTIIPDSLDNGNVTFELDEDNFIMPAGSNADVTLTAKASGSSTPGSYTAELEIKSEVPPAPIAGATGGSAPLYSVRTSLFGVEKTYYTERDGDIRRTIKGTSQDGNLTLNIPKYTTALDDYGRRLRTLEVTIDETPPDPPEDSNIIGLPYNFGPAGATFDPFMTLTWTYSPDNLPEGVAEEDLILAYYIDGEWIELECVVDVESNTVTASVKHFTTFALIGTVVLVVESVISEEPVVEEPEPIPVLALAPTSLAPVPGPVPIPAPAVTPPAPVDPGIVWNTLPSPEVPESEPETPVPWGLVGGLLAGGLLVGGLGFWLWRRLASRG